jgi:hypothetical protein
VRGWEYVRVDTPTRERLQNLAAAYLERLEGDVEGDDAASDDEDDER